MLASYWAGNILNPQLNSQLTAMISHLPDADPIAGIKSVPGPGYVIGQDSLACYAQTSSLPNYSVWDYPGGTLILLGGMQQNAQLGGITAGWLALPEPPSTGGLNPAFEIAAFSIYTQRSATFAGNNGPYQIIGHSYGAGVACALAVILAGQGKFLNGRLVTYGMPKVGNFVGCTRVLQQRITQWVLEGDPIVRMPPVRAEAPGLYAVLPRSVADGWNVQQYISSSFLITTAGDISQNRLTVAVMQNLYLSAAEFLASPDSFGDTTHQIAAYNGAFNSAVGKNAVVPTNPAPLPQPPFVRETARQREALIRIGEAAIFADATSPTGVTRTYAVVPVTTPTAPRYQARHTGTSWVIYLGTDAVAVGTGKRQAKSLARKWNRAARATLSS